MHGKDTRMRGLDEMMNGIKTIKYNCYEELFEIKVIIHLFLKVHDKRKYELNRLMKQGILKVLS